MRFKSREEVLSLTQIEPGPANNYAKGVFGIKTKFHASIFSRFSDHTRNYISFTENDYTNWYFLEGGYFVNMEKCDYFSGLVKEREFLRELSPIRDKYFAILSEKEEGKKTEISKDN